MSIKLLKLPNVDKFLNLVAQSRGDVLLQLPDGNLCDLRRDHTAREMLRILRPGREGISIHVSDPSDAPSFLRYMMEVTQ